MGAARLGRNQGNQHNSNKMQYGYNAQNGPESAKADKKQHFMQDAIEKKIEKFSSQNANTQKRVNTSSKYRGGHPVLGSLTPGSAGQTLNSAGGQLGGGTRPTIAGTGGQKHPGSSGGLQGTFGPTVHKKKYSIAVNPGSANGSLDQSDQEEETSNNAFYKDTQAVIKQQLKKRKAGADEEKNLERQTNDRQLRMAEMEGPQIMPGGG